MKSNMMKNSVRAFGFHWGVRSVSQSSKFYSIEANEILHVDIIYKYTLKIEQAQ